MRFCPFFPKDFRGAEERRNPCIFVWLSLLSPKKQGKEDQGFPGIFKRENGPLRHSGKRPTKVGKRLIKEGKRPINANGQFSGAPTWWKTAPLKRPIKRSMIRMQTSILGMASHDLSNPWSSFPCFSGFPFFFFLARIFLALLSVFPFFPKDFRSLEERKNPCFFGWVSLLFPKKARKTKLRMIRANRVANLPCHEDWLKLAKIGKKGRFLFTSKAQRITHSASFETAICDSIACNTPYEDQGCGNHNSRSSSRSHARNSCRHRI